MTDFNTLSDPNISGEEKEFTINFTTADEKATVYSNIRSQIDRLLDHTDVECTELTVYTEDTNTYRRIGMEEYDGTPIVSYLGTVPIESLKIGATPRGNRSYAQIISEQEGVSFSSKS